MLCNPRPSVALDRVVVGKAMAAKTLTGEYQVQAGLSGEWPKLGRINNGP